MGAFGFLTLCAESEREEETFCFWQDLFFSLKENRTYSCHLVEYISVLWVIINMVRDLFGVI